MRVRVEKEEVGEECKGKRAREGKRKEMEGQYTMVMTHTLYPVSTFVLFTLFFLSDKPL